MPRYEREKKKAERRRRRRAARRRRAKDASRRASAPGRVGRRCRRRRGRRAPRQPRGATAAAPHEQAHAPDARGEERRGAATRMDLLQTGAMQFADAARPCTSSSPSATARLRSRSSGATTTTPPRNDQWSLFRAACRKFARWGDGVGVDPSAQVIQFGVREPAPRTVGRPLSMREGWLYLPCAAAARRARLDLAGT